MRDNTKALVERLRKLYIIDEVGSDNPLGRDAADAIERLERELVDAYEKAAQVCDEHIEYLKSLARADRGDAIEAAMVCAEEIRALKGKV